MAPYGVLWLKLLNASRQTAWIAAYSYDKASKWLVSQPNCKMDTVLFSSQHSIIFFALSLFFDTKISKFWRWEFFIACTFSNVENEFQKFPINHLQPIVVNFPYINENNLLPLKII